MQVEKQNSYGRNLSISVVQSAQFKPSVADTVEADMTTIGQALSPYPLHKKVA